VYVGLLEVGVIGIIKLHIISQVYASSYAATYSWYPPGTRAIGTTDHPEVLALFLMTCIALVPNLATAKRQVAAMVITLVGLALTGERLPLVLAIAIMAISFARRPTTGVRIRFAIVVTAVIGLGIAAYSSLFSVVLHRIGNDQGSISNRWTAWHEALSLVPHNVIAGVGLNGTTGLEHQLGASFESPLLIFSVSYGLIITSCLLLSQAWMALRHWRYEPLVVGSSSAILAVLLYIEFFNSIATETLIGPIVGLTMGLSMCRLVPVREQSLEPMLVLQPSVED
jgi:hypothetical protein